VQPGSAQRQEVAMEALLASGQDAKGMLNHMCQKLKSSPVGKGDIVYCCNKVGPNQYQAVVTLMCMEGQEFAGEVCETAKDAEKQAASQAVEAHSATYETCCLMGGPPKTKKRKTDGGGGVATLSSLINPNGEDAGALVNAGDNPSMTDKVKLNSVCMRIKKGPLTKGETLYASQKTTGGYQATVTLKCLPGEWAEAVWAGEVQSTKQLAEQSAATIALQMIEQNPELAELSKEVPKVQKKGNFKGGKGKGKGYGKNNFVGGYGGGYGGGCGGGFGGGFNQFSSFGIGL